MRQLAATMGTTDCFIASQLRIPHGDNAG